MLFGLATVSSCRFVSVLLQFDEVYELDSVDELDGVDELDE